MTWKYYAATNTEYIEDDNGKWLVSMQRIYPNTAFERWLVISEKTGAKYFFFRRDAIDFIFEQIWTPPYNKISQVG